MSLPVTVAKHGTQDPEGWATIIWDNSFFEINRAPFVVVNQRIADDVLRYNQNPFAVRNEVPWSHMEWALSIRFYYQTGCTLTADHLEYLCKYRIHCLYI